MKFPYLVLFALCWLRIQSLIADDQPLRLAVDLTDGSHVIGSSVNQTIGIHTDVGKLQVSLRSLDQVRWKSDREHIVLEFPNGDRLTGAVIPEIIHLHTLFGDARISMEHIVLLKPIPAKFGSVPMLDGLVLYLPFDEIPASGVVANRMGQLYGKLQGGQWVREGRGGGTYRIRNAEDGIVFSDHESLRPRQLTLSVWVNPDQSSRAQSTYRGIIAKCTPGSWNGGYGLARYPGQPDVHFFVNSYSGETAHAPIPDGTWTHLAGTYDEQTLTLYVNGAKAGVAIPHGASGGAIRYGKLPLLIGQAPNGYGWFGELDDVMLFNRALSAAEISRLYQATRKD